VSSTLNDNIKRSFRSIGNLVHIVSFNNSILVFNMKGQIDFSMWKRAELLKEKVLLEGTAQNSAFFTFIEIPEPPHIALKKEEGKYTYLQSCDCRHHSIHGGLTDMKSLCVYVLAVYKALPLPSKFIEK